MCTLESIGHGVAGNVGLALVSWVSGVVGDVVAQFATSYVSFCVTAIRYCICFLFQDHCGVPMTAPNFPQDGNIQ